MLISFHPSYTPTPNPPSSLHLQALTHQQSVNAKEADLRLQALEQSANQRLLTLEASRSEAVARADVLAARLDATLSRLAALEAGAAAAAATTAAAVAVDVAAKDKAVADAAAKDKAVALEIERLSQRVNTSAEADEGEKVKVGSRSRLGSSYSC